MTKFCKLLFLIVVCGPSALGEKGSYDFTNVSRSVGKHVFPKTAHRISLKSFMKLRLLKGKKLIELDLWEKNDFGYMPRNTPKIGFFFFDFAKKIVC